ncbi:hypothetical protein JHD50_02880 [Sulfurimonas sp. MAG313]|nr:hypothetical protein [Sulfurimonas sp. MAG313]MDF1880256.1 hypothetical protein [Sulfurimonas sp. MAG313]
MKKFKEIKPGDSIKEVIKAAFDTELDVNGEWGYTKELSSLIKGNEQTKQVEHTLATMRAYIEMNMTLEKEDRYGSINLNEIKRKEEGNFHKVSYEISAMQEDEYAFFINEYKQGHSKPDFDISDHFKRRKQATLIREVTHWFKLL